MSVLVALAIGASVVSVGLAIAVPPLAVPSWSHPDGAALRIVAPAWSATRFETVRFAAVLIAAALAAALGAWIVVPIAALAPSIVVRSRAAALRDRAAAGSIEVLRAAHAALRAGMPLATALEVAQRGVDPLTGAPFAAALQAFALNAPLAQAIRSSAADVRDPRVSLALEAFALLADEQLPASRSAELIASVADRLAFEGRLIEEVRARTGGMRAQIVLLALVVPALAGYLVLSMPGLAATLATPLGTHVLVPAAALLEVAGIASSRAIMRGIAR